MTEEEAITRLWIDEKLCPHGGHGEARRLVKSLVALGVIKLDAPETPEDKLWKQVTGEGRASIYLTRERLHAMLNAADLKIVEADK